MSKRGSALRAAFSQPTFVACVVVLAASAIGLETTVRVLGLQFRKQPVPLRRPLDQLDMSKLLPEYEFVAAHAIQPDILGELGTDQYLNCILREKARKENDPQGYWRVLVTYYTGDPDQVPHVPDMCYLGGGFQRRESRKVYLAVPALGSKGDKIPIRVLSFGKQGVGARRQVVVMYVFSANGRFECDRQRLRVLLGKPLERYAYFSKVEISLSAPNTSQAAMEAGTKLLRKLLPILVSDHWPDWEALTDRQ